MSYCPLVERLGFDENFMDVTEMVERRLKETRISDLSFSGHIYKHECESEHHFKQILTCFKNSGYNSCLVVQILPFSDPISGSL